MTVVTARTRLQKGAGSRDAGAGGSLAIGLVSLAVFLAVWEAIPRSGLVSRTVIPTGLDTLNGLRHLVAEGYWWGDLWATLFAVFVAWLLGCTLGISLGVVLGVSPFVRAVTTPYLIAVQALPKIVLAPLFIGWLGFGGSSKIAVAVAICFFPAWIDTMIGLTMPSADELRLMKSLRASRWQIFQKLQLPSAVPLIMVGVKHAMLLAFTGVLVAEILSASAGGLGTLVKQFSQQLTMDLAFAVIVVILVIAVVLVSVMDVAERRVVFWSEESRGRSR